MRVLVTGATGFVGSRLVAALAESEHDIRAMTRRPETYSGPGHAVRGDIADAERLRPALEGCGAAYYLIHSLDDADFATRDREGAHAFGLAAKRAGLAQIIYLGGLGADADELSEHLASRREVEHILASYVPTTVLRAGIVIGDGGISWEILRQLVHRLPVMVTSRWVQTRIQPIAIEDIVTFLVCVLGNDGARRPSALDHPRCSPTQRCSRSSVACPAVCSASSWLRCCRPDCRRIGCGSLPMSTSLRRGRWSTRCQMK